MLVAPAGPLGACNDQCHLSARVSGHNTRTNTVLVLPEQPLTTAFSARSQARVRMRLLVAPNRSGSEARARNTRRTPAEPNAAPYSTC